MLNKIKNIAMSFALVATLSVPVLAPVSVGAAGLTGALCEGSAIAADTNTQCNANTSGSGALTTLARNVVNIISIVVGFVAVVMIIVGGFRYITSGGESSNVSGAKNTLIYAIVGLIIVALAQFIVRFVIGGVVSIQ